MKLPKRLTTVTEFSRVFAGILFVIIPIITLLLGYMYGVKAGMAQQLVLDSISAPANYKPVQMMEPTKAMMKNDVMMKKTATPSVMMKKPM